MTFWRRIYTDETLEQQVARARERARTHAALLAAREAKPTPDREANLLTTDDSEIAAVPDARRRAWEPRRTGYSREDFERDRALRPGPGEDERP